MMLHLFTDYIFFTTHIDVASAKVVHAVGELRNANLLIQSGIIIALSPLSGFTLSHMM